MNSRIQNGPMGTGSDGFQSVVIGLVVETQKSQRHRFITYVYNAVLECQTQFCICTV